MSGPTHVVCFGNLWQGDDGFGIHVFRHLLDVALPPHVHVFEAGVAGFGALAYFEGCAKVIAIDAMRLGGQVGEVRCLDLEHITAPSNAFSMHMWGAQELLAHLDALMQPAPAPPVVVIGAEIGDPERFTDTLTPAVAAASAPTVAKVLEHA